MARSEYDAFYEEEDEGRRGGIVSSFLSHLPSIKCVCACACMCACACGRARVRVRVCTALAHTCVYVCLIHHSASLSQIDDRCRRHLSYDRHGRAVVF